VHPCQISPDWGAQRVKGLSLMKAVLSVLTKPFRKDQKKQETSLIEQYVYPKKGPGQYWELMAQKIVEMGGEIHMNARVVGLDTEGGAVKAARVKDNTGRVSAYHADAFFSSMPVKDLVEAMGERVEKLVGEGIAQSIWVHTFHTACVRILRQEIEHLGYLKNFVIFDSQDQLTVVKNALKALNLSDKNFQPRAVLNSISSAKNELIDVREYERKAADFWSNTVAEVYKVYQKRLHENNGLDFDDLIMLTVRLFREFPDVLEKYQERFRYILIDEYQDTNHAQYVLVNLLASKYRNLCVVGDDDQSIYSFRSADVRNILEFESDFPEVKVIKLEQNYRSTQNILHVANEVIKNNRSRRSKRLWTENLPGDMIQLFNAADDREEAWFVAEEIARLVREKTYKYSDFALLYRTNAQSRSFEEAMIGRNIPYRVIG
jgi:DNA helicase-2/ATP-dependent DNA helicase PcrA